METKQYSWLVDLVLFETCLRNHLPQERITVIMDIDRDFRALSWAYFHKKTKSNLWLSMSNLDLVYMKCFGRIYVQHSWKLEGTSKFCAIFKWWNQQEEEKILNPCRMHRIWEWGQVLALLYGKFEAKNGCICTIVWTLCLLHC